MISLICFFVVGEVTKSILLITKIVGLWSALICARISLTTLSLCSILAGVSVASMVWRRRSASMVSSRVDWKDLIS